MFPSEHGHIRNGLSSRWMASIRDPIARDGPQPGQRARKNKTALSPKRMWPRSTAKQLHHWAEQRRQSPGLRLL